MDQGYPENHIPEKIIQIVGTVFLITGIVLLSISVYNFYNSEVNPGNLIGIGIVTGIFGAVLLLHNFVSKKISLVGTILFYCIAIAGTILSLYNPEVVETLIWIVSISSVIAMFFTLSLAAHSTLNPDTEKKE